MNIEPEFKKSLTPEEIQSEIQRIKDFFEQVPDDLKSVTAEDLIFETVVWGSGSHYEALGIFQEAMIRYREVSIHIMQEEAREASEAEQYENAINSSKKYRCIKELNIPGKEISFGEIRTIGFAGEDDRYSQGKKYYLFIDNDLMEFVDICQTCLDEHFELVG